jgi:hypothetical protein
MATTAAEPDRNNSTVGAGGSVVGLHMDAMQ